MGEQHVHADVAFGHQGMGAGEQEQRGVPETDQISHEGLLIGEDETRDDDLELGDHHEQ